MLGGGQNPRQSTLRTKKISFSFHYSEQFVCMCFHNLFTICALQKSLSLSCFPVHEILIFSQIKIRYIYMRSTQKLHRILEDGLFFFFRTQNIFWIVLRYKQHCTPITIIKKLSTKKNLQNTVSSSVALEERKSQRFQKKWRSVNYNCVFCLQPSCYFSIIEILF